MSKLKLSAPWETFYSEVKELFSGDPKVKVAYDAEAQEMKLYVDGERKAAALTELLPAEKHFGNVVVKIEVIPANKDDEHIYNLYKDAFDGNEVVDDVVRLRTPDGGSANYIMFRNEVVQFFNDDISDPRGMESTLYENIAREVFVNQGGEFYSTSCRYARTVPLPYDE